MLIRVRVGEMGSDAAEPNGEDVWAGGDSHEADKLPAAALVAQAPDIEVGSWYRLSEFRAKLNPSAVDEPAPLIWTTVDVNQTGVTGKWNATVEIPQSLAVRLICDAVMAHVGRLHEIDQLWIRVE